MRRAIERVAQRALGEVGSPYRLALPAPPPPPTPPDPPPPPLSPTDFVRDILPGLLASERASVTHLLFEHLSAADRAEVEQRLEQEAPELQAHYESAPTEPLREALILIYGVWLRVPAVIEKTGMTGDQPPEDVHAMARGPLSAAGGLYEADLVVDALSAAGVEIFAVHEALDFGCSSGRVVRALAAAHPGIRWHGCDPNGPAIAWATEHLPGIEFFVNGDAPPLPLADGSLDLVYAISIWSHFAPDLGLRWFEEIRRVIRPGGSLVLTTHGLTAIAYYARHQLRTPEQSQEIRDSLYREGCWYAPEFGEEGDWGVVNPDWGTAFLSPEWMLAKLCPQWRVLEFAPGRNQENQDVYVLQRV
jgi:SAM-dependent methyltransferase